MKLIDIYRARYDGRTKEALAAASLRLEQLAHERSDSWMEMWTSLMCLKGDCYLDLGDYLNAEACFNEVYNRTRNPIALGNRAYARESLKRLEEAKADYIMALTLPSDNETKEVQSRNLASLCIRMNDLNDASKYLQQARNLVGDSFEVIDFQRELDRARRKMVHE